jgi:hypothetical protein
MITPIAVWAVWSALILLSIGGTLFVFYAGGQITDTERRMANLSAMSAGPGVLLWTESTIRMVLMKPLPLEGWFLPIGIVGSLVGVVAFVPITKLLCRDDARPVTRAIASICLLAWAVSSGVALVAFAWI